MNTIERQQNLAYLYDRSDDYRFSIKEVALITGFSVRTMERYVEAGLLKEIRIPSARGTMSRPRYTRAAIKAFLDSGYLRYV